MSDDVTGEAVLQAWRESEASARWVREMRRAMPDWPAVQRIRALHTQPIADDASARHGDADQHVSETAE